MTDEEPQTTGWRKRWHESKGPLAIALGVVVVALAITVAFQSYEILNSHTKVLWGSISEALGAIGTLLAVGVALWQSWVIRRQAEKDAVDAARRFSAEVEAANRRTIQEVEAAERRSQRELAAAAERHEAELQTQREVARTQRVHLREQEFKLALIRVSKAASAYTHELATLIEQTGRVVNLEDREDRSDALRPISKKLGALAEDLSVEISGAHMLTNNERLHDALDRINEEALAGPMSENIIRDSVIIHRQDPDFIPAFRAMEAIHRVIGDARRLAGELLVTGWD